jgi:hypothetical protein
VKSWERAGSPLKAFVKTWAFKGSDSICPQELLAPDRNFEKFADSAQFTRDGTSYAIAQLDDEGFAVCFDDHTSEDSHPHVGACQTQSSQPLATAIVEVCPNHLGDAAISGQNKLSPPPPAITSSHNGVASSTVTLTQLINQSRHGQSLALKNANESVGPSVSVGLTEPLLVFKNAALQSQPLGETFPHSDEVLSSFPTFPLTPCPTSPMIVLSQVTSVVDKKPAVSDDDVVVIEQAG